MKLNANWLLHVYLFIPFLKLKNTKKCLNMTDIKETEHQYNLNFLVAFKKCRTFKK